MAKKVLFINQEISPYVPDTELSVMGREVPNKVQESGFEIRTFMPKWGTINERRGQWEVRFDEVKSFECETTKLWRFNLPTDHMIVHLKNGNGYVKMFSTDGLTIKQHELCDLLNERLHIFNEKKSQ